MVFLMAVGIVRIPQMPKTAPALARPAEELPMKNRPRETRAMTLLLAQAELVDQRAVGVCVARLEIVEKLAPARHHAQEAAARVVILDVALEVVRETVDAGGEERDLDFGRSRIALPSLVFGDHLRLVVSRRGHDVWIL